MTLIRVHSEFVQNKSPSVKTKTYLVRVKIRKSQNINAVLGFPNKYLYLKQLLLIELAM